MCKGLEKVFVQTCFGSTVKNTALYVYKDPVFELAGRIRYWGFNKEDAE